MFTSLTPLDWKRRAVKYYPNKVAVIDGEKKFTYKQFSERTDLLSKALYQVGIREKDLCCRIPIICWNVFTELAN